MFGGSFDPPHLAHLEIIKYCAINFDTLVLVPTNKSPLKEHFPKANFNERFEMINLMISNISDNIIIDRYEAFLDKKNRYAVFSQKKFDYKLNLLNETEGEWLGSKICLKKYLKSPQWLRDLKFKKYPFWRIDKPKNLQIIENGGWHFAYLQNPKNISKKIKSFSHGEFNTKDFTDEVNIEEKIKLKKDIFNRGYSYSKVEIGHTFPKYIIENKEKLKDWILK